MRGGTKDGDSGSKGSDPRGGVVGHGVVSGRASGDGGAEEEETEREARATVPAPDEADRDTVTCGDPASAPPMMMSPSPSWLGADVVRPCSSISAGDVGGSAGAGGLAF